MRGLHRPSNELFNVDKENIAFNPLLKVWIPHHFLRFGEGMISGPGIISSPRSLAGGDHLSVDFLHKVQENDMPLKGFSNLYKGYQVVAQSAVTLPSHIYQFILLECSGALKRLRKKGQRAAIDLSNAVEIGTDLIEYNNTNVVFPAQ